MYSVFRRWLFQLAPEQAHAAGFAAAQVAQIFARRDVQERFSYASPVLSQRLAGIDFPNPVGLAAGFDKDARLLPFWELMGLGYVEAGSVTAHRSRGNARPRAFRLPLDSAIINRMGLPNQGARRVARRIARVHKQCRIPLGISLANSHAPHAEVVAAADDYRRSFMRLAPLADYVTLNISCPNTAHGKTFEHPPSLNVLLEVIFRQRAAQQLDIPVFLKLSPPASARIVFDSQIEEILSIGQFYGVHGYIACNTASDRVGLQTGAAALAEIGAGGLSGPPLRARSVHLVRYLYRRLQSGQVILGVGGIDSALAAYEMIRAGASLVQLYTGLVYKGPEVVRAINEGLVALCARDGLGSIADAVGTDAAQ